MRRGATSCCRTRSPALSEAAGLILAVERRANLAVLGEAPEELSFTLGDPDRVRNFSASTRGGCTSERAGPRSGHQRKASGGTMTAVVTGASRGIGRAIALALARAGDEVALWARTAAQLAD